MMLTFLPVSRTGDYETILFIDIQKRLSRPNRTKLIVPSLCHGELRAYIQLVGETRFFRVPRDYWLISDGFDDNADILLKCRAHELVPSQFHNLPLLCFVDEADAWICDLGPPYCIERDYDWDAFPDCHDRAKVPSAGYWSAFATLAWIASRDEKFVAATQIYEEEQLANKGGAFTVFAWWTLGKFSDEIFGCPFAVAESQLRDALESNILNGGIAIDVRTGISDEVPRARWGQWRRDFENDGLMLVPGLRECKWPAEAVRNAFPPSAHLCDHNAQSIDLRGKMPAHAKRNDLKHEEYAHAAATLVREQNISPQTAFQAVRPEEAMRTEASIIKAIRLAFEKMYDPRGHPLKIDQN